MTGLCKGVGPNSPLSPKAEQCALHSGGRQRRRQGATTGKLYADFFLACPLPNSAIRGFFQIQKDFYQPRSPCWTFFSNARFAANISLPMRRRLGRQSTVPTVTAPWRSPKSQALENVLGVSIG